MINYLKLIIMNKDDVMRSLVLFSPSIYFLPPRHES
jgi:hypothetical protein